MCVKTPATEQVIANQFPDSTKGSVWLGEPFGPDMITVVTMEKRLKCSGEWWRKAAQGSFSLSKLFNYLTRKIYAASTCTVEVNI